MVRRLNFGAHVGRKTIRSSVNEGTANYTREAKAGMQQVLQNYKKLVQHLEDMSPDVLLGALEPAFELSKEYCPKDTGALVESGYLQVTRLRGVPTVEIGYGLGGDPEYAAAVHENLEWRHKSPTRAKWLQVALEEEAPHIQQLIKLGYGRIF